MTSSPHDARSPDRPVDPADDARPDDSPRSGSRSVSVRVTRRVARRLVWLASVAISFALGWFGSSVLPPLLDPSRHAPAVESRPLAATDGLVPPAVTARDAPAPVVPEERPAVTEAPPPAEPAAPKAAAKPRPAAVKPKPAPESEPEPEPEPVAEAVAAPIEPAIERSRRASRLADEGDAEGARAEAAALLADHESYSGLSGALEADGADAVEARLAALHVVQLAGHESVAIDLARELKRSYAGTPRVLESIREWGLLIPRIVAIDTSIEAGSRVVVAGTVENPDIGDIRRVFVDVEALDAAGNVLAVERTRVRPKSVGPGESGSFDVTFRQLDPATVLRTRATVVEWESEVVN